MNNATTTQAKSLRNQIDLLAAEYRVAELTETRAELRSRKARIVELEGQLTDLLAPEPDSFMTHERLPVFVVRGGVQ